MRGWPSVRRGCRPAPLTGSAGQARREAVEAERRGRRDPACQRKGTRQPHTPPLTLQIRRKAGQDAARVREELEHKGMWRRAALPPLTDRANEAGGAKAPRAHRRCAYQRRVALLTVQMEAKARVRQQIEEDKRARAEKAAREKALRSGQPLPGAAAPGEAPKPTAPRVTPSNANETRLRVRAPGGTWMGTLSADATLADVERAVAQDNKAGGATSLTVRTDVIATSIHSSSPPPSPARCSLPRSASRRSGRSGSCPTRRLRRRPSSLRRPRQSAGISRGSAAQSRPTRAHGPCAVHNAWWRSAAPVPAVWPSRTGAGISAVHDSAECSSGAGRRPPCRGRSQCCAPPSKRAWR